MHSQLVNHTARYTSVISSNDLKAILVLNLTSFTWSLLLIQWATPQVSCPLNTPSSLPEAWAQSDLFLDSRPVIYSCNTHRPVAPPRTTEVPRVRKVCFLSGGLQLTMQQGYVTQIWSKTSHVSLSFPVFTVSVFRGLLLLDTGIGQMPKV